MTHRVITATRLGNARRMRTEMTDAERKLWHTLIAHRLAGFGFRRQVPIGPFIADFVSHGARLVVEVDGGQHSENRADSRRDQWFSDRGYAVLRFWNNDVLRNLEGVATCILETAKNRAAIPPLPAAWPPPSPSRREGSATATGEVKR